MSKNKKVLSIYEMIIKQYEKKYNYLFEKSDDFITMVNDIINEDDRDNGFYDPILEKAFVPSYRDKDAVRRNDWYGYSDNTDLKCYVSSICSIIYERTGFGNTQKDHNSPKSIYPLYKLIFISIVRNHPDFSMTLDSIKDIIVDEINNFLHEFDSEIKELQRELENTPDNQNISDRINDLIAKRDERKLNIMIGYGTDYENPTRDYSKWNERISNIIKSYRVVIANKVYKRLNPVKQQSFLSLYDVILKPYYLKKYNKNGKSIEELQCAISKIVDFCLSPKQHDVIGLIRKTNMVDYLSSSPKKVIVSKVREILYRWILYGDRLFLDDNLNFYDRIFEIINDNNLKNTLENRRVIDLIVNDELLITQEERDLLHRAFGDDFYHSVKDYANWDFCEDEKKLTILIEKITTIFLEKLPQIRDMEKFNHQILVNYRTNYTYVIPFYISIEELNTIFNKEDARIIYYVIVFNNMWNNQDFKDKLGMSIDEVRDRVLKILSSHIQTECNHPQIHMIYKICLKFLQERKSSYAKARVQ